MGIRNTKLRTKENSKLKFVLVIKNQEDVIEGVVRELVSNSFFREVINSRKFIILDMGSSDQTGEILSRLKKDYECLKILRA